MVEKTHGGLNCSARGNEECMHYGVCGESGYCVRAPSGDAQRMYDYGEGRKDQCDEDMELLRWAYSKLHHISFTKQEDALMQDRLKLLLEHGIRG